MDKLERIAQDIENKGWCVMDDALPQGLNKNLYQHLIKLPNDTFNDMGIGRGNQLHIDKSYRSDQSHWLDGATDVEKEYLAWMETLRLQMNQRLYMGLFDYEAHFAHYAPQSFYKRHVDTFSSKTNTGKPVRQLTTVYYLNPDWSESDGGELLIYKDDESKTPFQTVTPQNNRMVVFLSDTFPHEVLPAVRDRYSIAGWFRLKA